MLAPLPGRATGECLLRHSNTGRSASFHRSSCFNGSAAVRLLPRAAAVRQQLNSSDLTSRGPQAQQATTHGAQQQQEVAGTHMGTPASSPVALTIAQLRQCSRLDELGQLVQAAAEARQGSLTHAPPAQQTARQQKGRQQEQGRGRDVGGDEGASSALQAWDCICVTAALHQAALLWRQQQHGQAARQQQKQEPQQQAAQQRQHQDNSATHAFTANKPSPAGGGQAPIKPGHSLSSFQAVQLLLQQLLPASLATLQVCVACSAGAPMQHRLWLQASPRLLFGPLH